MKINGRKEFNLLKIKYIKMTFFGVKVAGFEVKMAKMLKRGRMMPDGAPGRTGGILENLGKLAVSSYQLVANSKKLTANSQRLTANSQKLTANSQQQKKINTTFA